MSVIQLKDGSTNAYSKLEIKEITVTSTTNESGAAQIGLSTDAIIVGVRCLNNDAVLPLPWKYASTGPWYILCFRWDNWLRFASTSLQFKITYIEP